MDDWFIVFVLFPINIWLLIKLVVPIPPRETVKIPDVTLEAFKDVKPLPFTDNVPDDILEEFIEVKPLPFTDKIPVVY